MMRRRRRSLGALFLCLSMLGACDDDAKSPDTAGDRAGLEKASQRLEGAWVKVEEFGGGECAGLDCSAPLPEERQSRLELAGEGTFRDSSPSGPSMAGTWKVTKSAGDTLDLEMRLEDFPASPKSVVFLADDRIEMRANNRHGGIYQRASS